MIDFVTRSTHLVVSMKNAAKLSLLPLSLLFFFGAPACTSSSDSDSPSPGTGAAGAAAAGSPGGVGTAGASSPGASGAAPTGTAGASNSTAGSAAIGGATGSAGSGSATGTAGGNGTGTAGAAGAGTVSSAKFSFFVTSMAALQSVSGNPNGFGGDLRFGETGAGAGLRGADKICSTIADRSMPGNGKAWRAFLSAVDGGDGKQVNAIDRIGAGPWDDRLGRLVANNVTDLANTRPVGADAAIAKDLPNEDGIPNHQPDPTQPVVDNHDTLTGSDATGKLYKTDLKFTCNDWTTNEATTWGSPRVGHSWPRSGGPAGMGGGMSSGDSWISALDESGCGAGYHITTNDDGPPSQSGTTVGDGGGYGGFYCFALTP